MGDAKFKLEDILNKQKAPPQILDLANIKIETEEDFKNVIEKIPDYRIKPERMGEAFGDAHKAAPPPGGRSGRGGQPAPVPEVPYEFADPCPSSMRDVNISDLSSVNINWKMLTLARPKTKTDEEIFSKLVQLDKLRLQTRAKEEEQSLARGGKDPFIVVKNPSASKGGVAETSIKVCSECYEEFCSGTCKDFQYDSYQRLIIQEKEKEQGGDALAGGKAKKGKKGKGGRKKKKDYSLTKMPVDF